MSLGFTPLKRLTDLIISRNKIVCQDSKLYFSKMKLDFKILTESRDIVVCCQTTFHDGAFS